MIAFFLLLLLSLVLADLPEYCGKAGTHGSSFNSVSSVNGTLRAVQAVIRHGDRVFYSTLGSCWPNDSVVWNCTLTYASTPSEFPNENSLKVGRLFRRVFDKDVEVYPGNCQVGQLTDRGYHQQLENGKILRSEYIKKHQLVSPDLNTSEVYFRSDNEDRTVQSLQSLIQGLFPTSQLPNPVPMVDIHTRDYSKDNVAPNGQVCKGYYAQQSAARSSNEYKEHLATVTQPLINKVNAQLGTNMTDLQQFFDCLCVHLCQGEPIPVSLDTFNEIEIDQTWLYTYASAYPTVQIGAKYGIGLLLNDIHTYLKNIIEKKSGPKLSIISGHDTTILPILTALGITDPVWPQLASLMRFEVWQTKSSYSVRIIYNDETLKLECSDHDGLCSWADFEQLIESVSIQSPSQCATFDGN